MKPLKTIELIAPNQAEINKLTYAKAPTADEIYSFLKEVQIKPIQYERMVGMRPGTIADVKIGYRNLPAKLWHLVFQRIIPSYSYLSGFKKPKNSFRRPPRKVVYNANKNVTNSESIVDKLKQISR